MGAEADEQRTGIDRIRDGNLLAGLAAATGAPQRPAAVAGGHGFGLRPGHQPS
jgi:hypothetical protein